MKSRHFLIALTILLVACDSDGGGSAPAADVVVADDTGETAAPPAPVVFGLLSDTHVCGALDHHVSENVAAAFEALAALDPTPAFVVITGDLIDSQPGCAAADGVDPLDTFLALLDAAPLPAELVAGNHDYYGEEGPYGFVAEQSLVDDRYEAELGIPPYRAEVVTGVKFIYLNSMNGPLWDLSLGLNGSFGPEQLAWLDEELGDGMPTLLFAHHPPSLVSELDGDPTLADVLAVHPGTVLTMFFGHLHLFARGELEDVPFYLTADAQLGRGYHHVRVDPEARSVEVLNEDEIDYGEVEAGGCITEEAVPAGQPSGFEGSVQQLVITGVEADDAGLGGLLEDGLGEVPFVLRIGTFADSGLGFEAELVSGHYEGEPAEGDELPRYVAASADFPCLDVAFLYDDPCFETQPIRITLDVAEVAGLDFPEEWQARLALENLSLHGRMSVDGEPHLADGVLHMEADLTVLADDIKDIAVQRYCAGEVPCQPGENDNPACPEEPDASFYDEIPSSCDIDLAEGFTAKMLLMLIDGVTGHRIDLVASFETRVPTVSDEAAPGAVASDLFGVCE